MQKLSKRFNYLRVSEAALAIVLPAAFTAYWRTSAPGLNWPLAIAALLLVSYLLVQGASYWHLKHRAITKAASLPGFFGPLFGLFKKTNVVLLGVFAAALLLQIRSAGWSASLAWPTGLFAFAVLEHINYYHYQLMYDTSRSMRYVTHNRRLRRAALGTDLKRTLSAREPTVRRSAA